MKLKQANTLYLSNSSISNYMKCPRLFQLEYGSSRDNTGYESAAMQRGTVFHLGIEVALLARTQGKSVSVATAEGLQAATHLVESEQPLGADGIAMFTAYAPYVIRDTHIPVTLGNNTYGVELNLEVSYLDLLNSIHRYIPPTKLKYMITEAQEYDIILTGVVDALLAHDNNKITMYDWKSRTRFTSDADVRHDRQLYLYYLMLNALYPHLKINFVKQIQFLSKPPAEVSVNSNGRISKRQGKMLASTVTEYTRNHHDLSTSERDTLNASIVPLSDFIHVYDARMEITGIRTQMYSLHAWIMRIAQDYQAQQFIAVNNAYTCTYCSSKAVCTH